VEACLNGFFGVGFGLWGANQKVFALIIDGLRLHITITKRVFIANQDQDLGRFTLSSNRIKTRISTGSLPIKRISTHHRRTLLSDQTRFRFP
jgi:hypothetical protein